MANPNIVNVTTISGKVVGADVTTSAVALVSNSSASGKIFKINSLHISNVSANNDPITVDLYKNQTDSYHLAFEVVVPAGSTLVVVSKDTGIYLEENDSIRVKAGTVSRLEAVCSYEEIS